ncbi:MAG: ComEC/Rec2 family competence protein [Pseudomonadota bacterium]|nr:ComEC/Rec2 family competence protein [Pseudomonadota bacterium]
MARSQDKPSDDPRRPRRGLTAWAADGATLRERWARLAEIERRRAPLWAPALLAFGVWLYFALAAEPSNWLVALSVSIPAAALPLALAGRTPPAVVLAAALVAAGFASSSLRSQVVAAPVLAEPIDATLQGRVVEIARSRADRRQVTLSDLVVYGLSPGQTPASARITLLEGDFARPVRLGERIEVFARLGPPLGPVEPGGFDFRRHAWFDGLGAIGFARGPLVGANPETAGAAQAGAGPLSRAAGWLEQARGAMTEGILEALPGREGAFAAAILTGVRSEVRRDELQDLRDSNLAHLLAISGLHMGLLAGIAFAAARLAIAAAPALAVRIPAKKAAAGAALAAAAAYLLLSGASVATQRAFAMAAAALIAVMIDRPAISMRALAAAALVILLVRPESLLDAGFQMSFAATVALVAVYEMAREGGWLRLERAPEGSGRRVWPRRLALWAAGLLLTSLVAGLATAPFAAASFNRLTTWGLPANLAAAPIMAFWVAPFGALSAALAPLGLEKLALVPMGWGIGAILDVAAWAANMPGAVRPVPEAPAGALALVALGGLWVAVWRSGLRWAGAAAALAGLALWTFGAARPEVLVAPGGAAIGVLGPQGRAVDRGRGAGYAIESWLAADGDAGGQAEAAVRPGVTREPREAAAELSNGWRLILLEGLVRPERLAETCAPRTVIVAPAARAPAEGPCLSFDRAALDRLGALAMTPEGEDLRVRGALTDAAARPWGAPLDGR